VHAARAVVTRVLSGGRCIVEAITNTIADAKTAKGNQYVTALDGPFASDSIPSNDITYNRSFAYYIMRPWRTGEQFAQANFLSV
jgi:hypothetical protein